MALVVKTFSSVEKDSTLRVKNCNLEYVFFQTLNRRPGLFFNYLFGIFSSSRHRLKIQFLEELLCNFCKMALSLILE